jgi:TPR repeat protein
MRPKQSHGPIEPLQREQMNLEPTRRKASTIAPRGLVLVCMLALTVGNGARTADSGSAPKQGEPGSPADSRRITATEIQALRAAAERGNAESQVRLGFVYQSGEVVQPDAEEAVKWYRRAAESGHAEGMWRLGGMYLTGNGVARDERDGVRWCREAAEAGPADLKYLLGEMYERGEHLPQDYEEALKSYREAAKEGHARAMSNIGMLYAQGFGVERSETEAAAWYRRGAEAGDEMGMGLIADAYAGGWGVPRDDAEAVKWLRKAVAGGHTPSLCRLGVMYLEGRGVPQSDTEAVAWWRRAAEAGDGEGMARLGLAHLTGTGVPQDDAEAAQWLLKAAQHGDAFAMGVLGRVYAEGVGVPRDLGKAAMWAYKGAQAGDDQAQEWLDAHAAELAAADLCDPNSDMRFPPTLGPSPRGRLTDYEVHGPGLGTSVSYSTARITATLYVYTRGFDGIADGIESAAVLSAFDGALAEIREHARSGAVKLTSGFASSRTALDPGTGTPLALYSRFAMVRDGVLEDSMLYVLGARGRIIKIRISRPAAGAAAAEVESNAFLKAVAAWLR